MKHGQQYILNWLTEPTKRSHQMNSVAAEVLGKFTRAFCNEHLATCTHLKGMEHLYVKRYKTWHGTSIGGRNLTFEQEFASSQTLFTKALRFTKEEPFAASIAKRCHFVALILSCFPFPLLSSSISIIILKHLVISFLSTIPSPSLLFFTLTPIFHTSSIILALVAWSAHNSHATVGTPTATHSIVKFHPQCVTKQPTDRWLKISTCEHHGTIFP
uniref:Uncharacterized protein n=1 Tax=Cucumis melo TaxID=3656 RepID=A0A9I9EC73_CUCME